MAKVIYKISSATNSDIQKVLYDAKGLAKSQVCDFAKRFVGVTDADTLARLWSFMKKRFEYSRDGLTQKIRLPKAFLKEGRGDCKTFALFSGAVLSCLGFEVFYKFTGGANDKSPRHVYIVVSKGGKSWSFDNTIERLNDEASYSKKKIVAWK
jgi:hypothetical protein